jgi:hypothetical protein
MTGGCASAPPLAGSTGSSATARKLHPDLRDWAYLSDEAKDKDRNAIRTLPATLRDAGFQILRLPEAT